jgi:hypothetical protein
MAEAFIALLVLVILIALGLAGGIAVYYEIKYKKRGNKFNIRR